MTGNRAPHPTTSRPTAPHSAAPHPTRLRSPRGALVTEIDWSDGATTRYAHRTLRGFCPCAQCQGHDGGVRWVEAVEQASPLSFEIAELEQVGNYALGVTWADHHTGGIYSFAYLRALAPLFDRPIDYLRAFRPR
ncbi:MAG TPA: DUF971 domain-containing protein [Polyangiaceae bacterium]|nr:DUF971 domain-containing protein [Polyangiaceae bacterium]